HRRAPGLVPTDDRARRGTCPDRLGAGRLPQPRRRGAFLRLCRRGPGYVPLRRGLRLQPSAATCGLRLRSGARVAWLRAARHLARRGRGHRGVESMDSSDTFRLGDVAHGRSGDKGNHANVAVLAYTPRGYAWLREHLTADAVAAYFASLGPSRVVRY